MFSSFSCAFPPPLFSRIDETPQKELCPPTSVTHRLAFLSQCFSSSLSSLFFSFYVACIYIPPPVIPRLYSSRTIPTDIRHPIKRRRKRISIHTPARFAFLLANTHTHIQGEKDPEEGTK